MDTTEVVISQTVKLCIDFFEFSRDSGSFDITLLSESLCSISANRSIHTLEDVSVKRMSFFV